MTELKTLKDLELIGKNSFKDNSVIILKDELKAEAIKWVKVLNIKAKELEGKNA